jgi:surface antigen
MRLHEKALVALGLASILLVAPFAASAVTTPTVPDFCNKKSQSDLQQAVCSTFSFAADINASLSVLTGRVDGLTTQVNQLKEKNAEQDAKIADLTARVTKLEPTPTPSPSPSPSPTPTPTQCGGGYPFVWCNAPQDTLVDNWGMYNRESVSYTAYKVSASGRNMPYWGGRGNANQWPDSARAAGIPVDGTPKAGDVAISMAGLYGHAMYVEAVSGNMVTVSQYNFAGHGEYSTMSISAGGILFIHFP